MSIVSIKPQGRNKARFGKYRSHTTNYKVITDSVMTTFELGLELAGHGLWYGNYAAFDPWCLCRDVAIDQDDLGLCYDLAIEWSSEPSADNMKDENGKPVHSPFDAFPQISTNSQEVTIAQKKDINGKKFVNTAGDPFNPPLTIQLNRNILTIVSNEEEWDMSENDYYSGTTNSTSFFDYEPKRCYFISSTGVLETFTDPETGLDEPYWKVTRIFGFLNQVEPDLNPLEVLNEGMRILITNPSPPPANLKKNIIVGEGTENAYQATEPIPIIETATAIAYTEDQLHYIEFENYYEEDYAGFYADWGLG